MKIYIQLLASQVLGQEEKEKIIDRYFVDTGLGEVVMQKETDQSDRLHQLFGDLEIHKPDVATKEDMIKASNDLASLKETYIPHTKSVFS